MARWPFLVFVVLRDVFENAPGPGHRMVIRADRASLVFVVLCWSAERGINSANWILRAELLVGRKPAAGEVDLLRRHQPDLVDQPRQHAHGIGPREKPNRWIWSPSSDRK